MKNACLQKMECVELGTADLKEKNGGSVSPNPVIWPLIVSILMEYGIDIEAIIRKY